MTALTCDKMLPSVRRGSYHARVRARLTTRMSVPCRHLPMAMYIYIYMCIYEYVYIYIYYIAKKCRHLPPDLWAAAPPADDASDASRAAFNGCSPDVDLCETPLLLWG